MNTRAVTLTDRSVSMSVSAIVVVYVLCHMYGASKTNDRHPDERSIQIQRDILDNAIKWNRCHYICTISVKQQHYSDIRMSSEAFQITCISIVSSTVCSDAYQRKKFCVTGPCEGNPPVTGGFPHKELVLRKVFPFDDVIKKKNLQYS